MLYFNSDYFDRFYKDEPDENDPSHLFLNRMENFCPEEDEDDGDDFDYDAFNALCQKFATNYVRKVFPMALDFYPQFRSKKAKLKEALIEDGKGVYETMYDMFAYYIAGKTSIKIDQTSSADISIQDIDLFIHNSALVSLMENYDAWFKRKTSFENIYVESICAGAYVKHIHNFLISMLYEFFPQMKCLSPGQLDVVYANLTTEAWFAYFTLTTLDPDELNDSYVLLNLEDYEFEPLLQWRGPEVKRNSKGKVLFISIKRNKLRPDQVPALCSQCKRFYNDDEINKLCMVYRFDQRNTEDFRCRAYEKHSPKRAN